METSKVTIEGSGRHVHVTREHLDTLFGEGFQLENIKPLSQPGEVGSHAVVGWEEAASGIGAADWLSRAAASTAFVYRTNSLVNQLVAAGAGIGLALLPCYLGDGEAGVTRALPEPLAELEGELWIVTHADLKATARVRAFFDLVGEGLARERELFEGRLSRQP